MIKKKEAPPTDVGVIIGRFQVDELTKAHTELIQSVVNAHPAKVVIVLGIAPIFMSSSNPLDWEMRKQMILEKFPNVNVVYQRDIRGDDKWSKQLDKLVQTMLNPSQTATLYGGRDSFIKQYKGKFPVQELESDSYISGTEVRKLAASRIKHCPEARAAIIYAAMNGYPKNFATVDIAIIDHDKNRLLLGRKEDEDKYRFVGGFSDPRSPTFEDDAKREVFEETHGLAIELSYKDYLGSFTIDDWRYERERDKIKTLFYKAHYMYGRPEPSDDIHELRWFDWIELLSDKNGSTKWYAAKREVRDNMVEEHLPLLDRLVEWYNESHPVVYEKEEK